MQLSLSRIEREYVLETLSNSLPALELTWGTSTTPISVPTYRVSFEKSVSGPSGAHIDFRLREGSSLDGQRVVVRFSHRKRRMRFESRARVNRDGLIDLSVPEEIFLDNGETGGVDRLSFEHEGILEEAFALESLPLDRPSDDAHPLKDGRLESIASRASIPGGNAPAARRLLDYVEEYRRKRIPPVATGDRGHFIFIDNACLLLAMYRGAWEAGGKLGLRIRLGRRDIRFSSRIGGIMPLSAESVVLTLSCDDAQEEDKRFLYERLYGGIYTGEGGLPIDAGTRE